MTTRIICLRHAEAEPFCWNSSRDGAVSDPPLTERGHGQAEAAVQLLADKGFEKVFVSDALRSRQTGEIIASHLRLETEVVPALAETLMNAGDIDTGDRGVKVQVLRQWIVDGNLTAQLADEETGQEVVDRMTDALSEIASKCLGSAIVVGHVASLTVGISALCNNGPSLWGRPLPHAVPFSLTVSDGVWQVDWSVPLEDGNQTDWKN